MGRRRRIAEAAAAALLAASAAAGPIESAGVFLLPDSAPEGLSGLVRTDGDDYLAVCDNDGVVWKMEIGVDRSSGAVTSCVFKSSVKLDGRKDVECAAWDAANGHLLAGDESDGSVCAFDPADGSEKARLQIPSIYGDFRKNRSFEALAIGNSGLEMWVCNEEALRCDGPKSSRDGGTFVRLQRFERDGASALWRADGQWAYATDSIGGENFLGKSRCGVASLCATGDGRLLALEREMSVKRGILLPTFRCRIYEIGFDGATDTALTPSLAKAGFKPVSKRRLYDLPADFAMYEGLCRGPVLDGGDESLLMVSDGDGGAVKAVCALRLKPRRKASPGF